jgi:quinol monooxygenase YgiN
VLHSNTLEEPVIAIVAKLKVQEGKGEAFEAAAREMVRAVGQNETGRALMYTLCRAQDDPTTYYFIEQYADADAVAAHGKTEHMAAFGGAIRELLAGRPEVTRLEPVVGLA